MTVGVFDCVVTQPLRIVSVGALDLGNHLVEVAINAESVDFRFSQQGRQGQAQLFHGYPHLRGFGPVDVDHHFGAVERQVDIHVGKFS